MEVSINIKFSPLKPIKLNKKTGIKKMEIVINFSSKLEKIMLDVTNKKANQRILRIKVE